MFNGSICALITPFRDGAVNEDAFEAFVDWQIEHYQDNAIQLEVPGQLQKMIQHNQIVSHQLVLTLLP